MSNLWFKYKIVILGTSMYLLSCSSDYPPGYIEQSKEYEQKWGKCYEERFNFPNEEEISAPEYLKCILDEKNISIIDQKSGFKVISLTLIVGIPIIQTFS